MKHLAKTFVIIAAIMFFATTSSNTQITASSGDKVIICHRGMSQMEVPASALQGHLNHGDQLGPCN